MISTLLALALAGADPCEPLPPATRPDAGQAARYLAVAEGELAAGRSDAAIVAYRAAAALNASDARARDALARLCEAPHSDPFQRGLARMDAGDFRAAAEAFHDARAMGSNPSAALLEGICRYELHEDDDASRALREAETHPAHRDEARLYLGLLALRSGDTPLALRLFEGARADPALADSAHALTRLARSEGRWIVTLSGASGWDSNVTLAPTAVPSVAGPESDALYALSGSIVFRPDGSRGPYLRASGFTREPVTLGAFAFRGLDGAAGWQLRRGASRGIVEYDFSARTFGGDPYLTAHRLLASGDLRTGPIVVGAAYVARFESYAAGWTAFSGALHRAELRLGLAPERGVALTFAYGVGRDDARDPTLSFVEHGPRAELRLGLSQRLRAGLAAAAGWRRYDRFDPALAARRSDVQLDGAAFLEVDVGPNLRARLSLDARRTTSTVPTVEYDKLVPTLGVTYARGL